MKTQKPQHIRVPLLLILTLAGPALALEETRPMQAVNEVLQSRIDQRLDSSLERKFYKRIESWQAPQRDIDTTTNHRMDKPAAADYTPPMAPVTQQYLSAR